MFARVWLLVESESEFWILPQVAQVMGYDLSLEGICPVGFAQCGIDPLVRAGRLPTFARRRAEGRTGIMLVTPPLISPVIWTTIATGAWPSTHGITCFNVHVPGEPLDMTHMGMNSDDSHAEPLQGVRIFLAGRSWPP